ncbi:PAS domain-containing protein [Desulfatibacillum alkenivorans DSM 16219]|jgi:signal transduction histidine kinase/ActR/RegA family two-component response regulator/Na+-transporting methylmalonyl-CoA/oxaloacetate decarboxylase gamma subunit|uniref:histidine kinase n=1 Tax=Desulfatibacillum alkenivorans DSM 16219 TaxID=1121393 RepID=A0A1M6TVE9_9BACT|nr:PAS domain-containing sensor histidine kinase [Desulfatibacillum alkenivorans]SHK60921.1 PAS domain-containing protein [Desulfatibacillum alkenivorans DSM 16219]
MAGFSEKSLRRALWTGISVVFVIFFLLAVNYWLTSQSNKSFEDLYYISGAKDSFYALTLSEDIALRDPSNFKDVDSKLKDLEAQCMECHDSRHQESLAQREALFQELYDVTRKSENSYFLVRERFMDLLASVKYIHQHHIVYLRNMVVKGESTPGYGAEDDFKRSSAHSASEVDIVDAASAIRTSLFDAFGIFHALEQGRRVFEVEKAFKSRIEAFYASVNTFEDYSLDAQDGILVEELLQMGREFEDSFENLLVMESRKRELQQRLEVESASIKQLLGDLASHFAQRYEDSKKNTRLLQLAALGIAFVFVFLNFFIGRRITRETHRIAMETIRIGQDISYQIPLGDKTFREFDIVLRTLNSMAGRLHSNLLRLEKSREYLEEAVEERTRELKLANAHLIDEMADRRKVQVALAESEERLKNVLDNISAGIIIIDADTYRVVSANPFAQNLLAPEGESLVGRNWQDHVDASDAAASPGNRARVGGHEKTLLDMHNRPVHVLSTVIPLVLDRKNHLLESFIDIRQLREAQEKRRELETQLERSRKMEAIGTLAGGIAHDFNNILAAIIGYSELAVFDLPEDHPSHANIQEVLKASERAKRIIKQILAFSRRSEPEQSLIRLEEILDEVLTLIRASFPSSIEIRKKIFCENDRIMGDSSQLHQVFMNLLTNARHAVSEETGVVEVAVESVDVTDHAWATKHSILPGPFLKISVSDNGHGMDEVTLQRIFDPYFTTKDKGKGTGMGLAVVEGVVTSHFGTITVNSKPGRGATFAIWLPAIEKGEETAIHGDETIQTGNESVLFVDDEEMLVKFGERMLSVLGYRVLAFTDPLAALEAFRENPGGFDLVVTDLTMPGLTGDKLASEILKIRPDMPIVLATGYTRSFTQKRALEIGIRSVFLKPLLATEFSQAIRKVLDETPDS